MITQDGGHVHAPEKPMRRCANSGGLAPRFVLGFPAAAQKALGRQHQGHGGARSPGGCSGSGCRREAAPGLPRGAGRGSQPPSIFRFMNHGALRSLRRTPHLCRQAVGRPGIRWSGVRLRGRHGPLEFVHTGGGPWRGRPAGTSWTQHPVFTCENSDPAILTVAVDGSLSSGRRHGTRTACPGARPGAHPGEGIGVALRRHR